MSTSSTSRIEAARGGATRALDDLDLPVMLLHDEAVRSNVRLMADYCAARGVHLAPHAKTSMTAYITHLQLERGAWGLTAATIRQARDLWGLGVRRILIANLVVEERAIAWVAETFLAHASEPSDVLVYVDSVDSLEILSSRLDALQPALRLGVLVELGFTGGRTGARSVHEAVELARRVSESPRLELRGVAGFEGLMPRGQEAVPPAIGTFLDELHALTERCQAENLFERRPVVTAGGSSYFDLVVDAVGPDRFGFPVDTILRSGCYATHDHGVYRETSPFDGRSDQPGGSRFAPALELVASVLSTPEPGLVIAGFGRRDVPTDDRLPVVVGQRHDDGSITPVEGARVVGVNDQHAFVSVAATCALRAGDRISLGVSHPCGAFDRWRSIPVVDARGSLVDVAEPRL
ncbi:alanine racemase [Aeromicrobium endophyticum]|nr:alanine racemase [Aeromicrobium endophyticum]